MAVQSVPTVGAVKAYIEQVAITQWDATITYDAGYLVIDAGDIYKSQVGSNLNNQPSTDTTNTYWIPFYKEYVDDTALALAIALG